VANKALIFFLVLALMLTGIVNPLPAQDTVQPARIDTLRPAAGDTARLNDTARTAAARKDTAEAPRKVKPYHSPRRAAFYSAVLPGMGQAYNREYWKIPLVYAAMGISAGFFFDNFSKYRDYRDAYRLRLDGNTETKDQFEGLYSDQSLKVLRDGYRQYVDYSVLVFILAYGLNIIDATVFAHLRGFDMSDDLSFRVTPAVIDNRALGVSLRIDLGKGRASRHKPAWTWGR
jgi:hypothetical protein